eukprot:296575-Chlamydomonas_euryale.AAC.1
MAVENKVRADVASELPAKNIGRCNGRQTRQTNGRVGVGRGLGSSGAERAQSDVLWRSTPGGGWRC